MSGVSGHLLDDVARKLIGRASDLRTVLDVGPGRGHQRVRQRGRAYLRGHGGFWRWAHQHAQLRN